MATFDTARTGIGRVTDLLWGSHICEFYEHHWDMLDSCAAYFKAGLEDNEMCVWVLPKIWVHHGWTALQATVSSLQAAREQKKIEIVTVEDCYFLKAL